MYVRTTWNHNVSQAHGRFNVLLESWLDKLVVLFDDTFDFSPPLCNISPQPADQPDVRVCVHKYLHIQQLMGEHEAQTYQNCTLLSLQLVKKQVCVYESSKDANFGQNSLKQSAVCMESSETMPLTYL